MKNRTLVGCCFAVIAMLCAGDAAAQLKQKGGGMPGDAAQGGPAPLPPGTVIRKYSFEPTHEKLKYGLFVPRKLDKSKPAPLVIALHDAGGSPESIMGPLVAAADKHQYILVAPTGYTDTGWYGFVRGQATPAERENSRLSELDVMNVLGLVKAEFNIDPRRIYLVGASMGGVGAVHLATKYPDQWAAIGVVSPAISGTVPEEFEKYAGVPAVVLHGDKDENVDIGLVRSWLSRLKDNKVPYSYFEVQGGTHSSVVQQVGEPVFSFLDKQARPEAAAAH